MSRGVGAVAGGLLAVLIPGLTAAQPAAPAAGVISYPASFYDQFRPSSARDMVERTPGFVLDKGEEVRGYGGAAGNVLIDGERPASKSVPLDMLLQRIPAGSVERIEVIRGGAAGVDMQGQSVLANVVRRSGAQSSSAAQLMGKFYTDGFVGIVGRADASWQAGPVSAEGQISGRRDVTTDSGHGQHVRRRATGEAYEEGPFDSRVLQRLYQANGAADYRAGLGTIRLNAAAERELSDRRDVARVRPFTGAAFDEVAEISRRETDFEFGADFERALTSAVTFNGLALQRLNRETLDARSSDRSAPQASDEQADSGESIVRAVVRAALPRGATIEVGAEGALNYLDAESALTVGGVAIPLPSANVRVEERRAEGFVTGTLRPAPSLTLESGLRVETSTIEQTGGANQKKTLTFAKPRVVGTWGAGGFQVRARFERVVGQLDFEDFAASSDLDVGTVNAGNADLEPERSWVSEIALERRFWGSAAVVLTLSHSKVDEVVDLIPIAGRFDAPGNIGSGTRDEARLNLSLPLDRFGAQGMQLRFNGTWRRSEVTDPVTGEARRISGQRPFEGEVFLTKSLPSLRSTIALEGALGFRETFYRINEIRTTKEAPLWKAIWDWTPRPDLLLRLQVENFTARDRVRLRTTYVGPRSAGQVNFRERRTAELSPMVTVRARKIF